MYSVALATHNILRWVVLALAADAQLLVGSLLYVFLSSLTKAAVTNLGAAMNNAGLGFFAVEHTVLVILAVVFANLGRVLSGRAWEATVKYRRATTWHSLAVVAMLIAMPWGRPLFPHLG